MDAVIFGDIAGNYAAFKRLRAKCPDRLPISVGDMIDRGPKSLEVMKFFARHGKAIRGNHEDMMLDHYAAIKYEKGLWIYQNGGDTTFKQLMKKPGLMEMYMDWVSKLPLFIQDEETLITHAPLHPNLGLDLAVQYASCGFNTPSWAETERADMSILWNRVDPYVRSQYQIFGHNGYFKRYFTDGGDEYACCIDATRSGYLAAIILPERRIMVEKI